MSDFPTLRELETPAERALDDLCDHIAFLRSMGRDRAADRLTETLERAWNAGWKRITEPEAARR